MCVHCVEIETRTSVPHTVLHTDPVDDIIFMVITKFEPKSPHS